MVRMSNCLTIACATILVAGSASAADKVNNLVAGSELSITRSTDLNNGPKTLRQAVGEFTWSASNFGFGSGCSCLWFNGAFDGRDGQASHEGGAITFGAKAADDFYLCEGFVYDLESICATLITDSIPVLTRARLEIYSDCGGRPDELLYTLEEFERRDGPSIPDLPGFRAVEYCFTIEDQEDLDCQNIVLKGGTYWVSVIGLSDCQGTDSSFFATTGNGIVKGSQAHKLEGDDNTGCNQYFYELDSWTPLEDCCIGCTDLAFTVCADACKILIDNGVADRTSVPAGSRSERSNSGRNSRSADDFVVNPCEDLRVCYIEGCVYTNCPEFSGFFEIYGNDCDEPSYVLGGTGPNEGVIASGEADCIVDLGFDVRIENRTLRAWRLEFHDLNFVLPRGRQYWISIGVQDTFSLQERAYFCYNDDCRRDDECLVRFNPGHVIAPALGINEWTSTGHDFAFLIAGDSAATTPGLPNAATPACLADADGNGNVTVEDVFTFLASWFTGCP